jgi:hypothetical protein
MRELGQFLRTELVFSRRASFERMAGVKLIALQIAWKTSGKLSIGPRFRGINPTWFR